MNFHLRYSLLALCAGCLDSSSESTSDQESRGATFTTTADGSEVNENTHYSAKEDVYLDGGPGPNAPSKAAALEEGDYFFQVTDPSGKTLLSSDALECRRFHVGAAGFIDAVLGVGCAHNTGVDADYGSQGALTVQLFPFADTPNHGGEYKVWVVGVEHSTAKDPFPHKWSKTDNFKVKPTTTPPDDDGECGCDECPPPPPPEPVCGDGTLDAGEECDDGNTTAGDGCDGTCKVEHSCPNHC